MEDVFKLVDEMDLSDGEREYLKKCIQNVLNGSADDLDVGYIIRFCYDMEPNRSLARKIVELLNI